MRAGGAAGWGHRGAARRQPEMAATLPPGRGVGGGGPQGGGRRGRGLRGAPAVAAGPGGPCDLERGSGGKARPPSPAAVPGPREPRSGATRGVCAGGAALSWSGHGLPQRRAIPCGWAGGAASRGRGVSRGAPSSLGPSPILPDRGPRAAFPPPRCPRDRPGGLLPGGGGERREPRLGPSHSGWFRVPGVQRGERGLLPSRVRMNRPGCRSPVSRAASPRGPRGDSGRGRPGEGPGAGPGWVSRWVPWRPPGRESRVPVSLGRGYSTRRSRPGAPAWR